MNKGTRAVILIVIFVSMVLSGCESGQLAPLTLTPTLPPTNTSTPAPTGTLTPAPTYTSLPPSPTTIPPTLTPTRDPSLPLRAPTAGDTIMDMGWIDRGTYQVWGANFGRGIEPDPSCRSSFEWICYETAGAHTVDRNDPEFLSARPNFWIVSDNYPWTYLGEYSIDGFASINFGNTTYTDILLTMPPGMGIDQLSGIITSNGESILVPYGYAYSSSGAIVPVLLANDTYGFAEVTVSMWESANHNSRTCGIVGGPDGLPDQSIGLAKYLVGDADSVLLLFRMLNNPYADVLMRSTYPQALLGLEIYSVDLNPWIGSDGIAESDLDAGIVPLGEYDVCP